MLPAAGLKNNLIIHPTNVNLIVSYKISSANPKKAKK
jgi:hypothetical protein